MTINPFQLPNNGYESEPNYYRTHRGAFARRWEAKREPSKCPLAIAPTTGPLDALQGRHVLVLADVENIKYSARNLGFTAAFHTIAHKLEETGCTTSLHAFFSRPAGDEQLSQYFTRHGWTPHARDIEIVSSPNGPRKCANADSLLLFWAGMLVNQSGADVVLILSGDGDLVSELAKAIHTLQKKFDVVTMSLAGSTAQRLDARFNGFIQNNIEIGLDCLRPISIS